MPVAGADQRQPAPLRYSARARRLRRARGASSRRAAGPGGPRRRRLLARMGDHRRHVAGGEDPRIAGRTQVSSIAMKPPAASGGPVSASQIAAASVTQSASSKSTRFPSQHTRRASSTRTISLAEQHGDPTLGEYPLEELADALILRGKNASQGTTAQASTTPPRSRAADIAPASSASATTPARAAASSGSAGQGAAAMPSAPRETAISLTAMICAAPRHHRSAAPTDRR